MGILLEKREAHRLHSTRGETKINKTIRADVIIYADDAKLQEEPWNAHKYNSRTAYDELRATT